MKKSSNIKTENIRKKKFQKVIAVMPAYNAERTLERTF